MWVALEIGSFDVSLALTWDLSRHHFQSLVQKCLGYQTSHALNMTSSAERSFNRKQHCGTETWLRKDLSRSHSITRYPLFRSCGLSTSHVCNVISSAEGTFNWRQHGAVNRKWLNIAGAVRHHKPAILGAGWSSSGEFKVQFSQPEEQSSSVNTELMQELKSLGLWRKPNPSRHCMTYIER